MIFSFLNFNFFCKDKVLIRRKSKKVLGFLKVNSFSVGDVLSVIFFSKNCPFSFEGLCLGIYKKSLLSPNVSFTISNYLAGVYMFMNLSYYCNRVYNMVFLNYKRNLDLKIRKSKLYYMGK